MSFYTKNGKTIFHSHIPKTGGSSVDIYFHRHRYIRTFWGGANTKSLQHRHTSDNDLIEEKKKYNIVYKFTIIRNPVERMLSEFFMKSLTHDDKTSEDFHNFTTHMIQQYTENNHIADNHIRPQLQFLEDNMSVFKFGSWNLLIEELQKYDNFDENFIHTNHATDFKNSLDFARDKLNWIPETKTEDIIKDFYKEDYNIYEQLV